MGCVSFATGMLSPGQIAPAIRHVVRRYENVRVELAEVTGLAESHGIEFQRRVAEGFRRFAARSQRTTVIDASGDVDEVFMRAERALASRPRTPSG